MIDTVEWKRFVGLLRDSADELTAADQGTDCVIVALAAPRLREAATRIEKVAELATLHARKPHLGRGERILKVLNGKG